MANFWKMLGALIGANPPAGPEPLRVDGGARIGATVFCARVQTSAGEGGAQYKTTTDGLVYVEFYHSTSAPGTRGAWAGFGVAGSPHFTIKNERVGGHVVADPDLQIAGGLARWGGTPPTSKPNITGNLTAPPSLAALGAVVKQIVQAMAGESAVTDGTT